MSIHISYKHWTNALLMKVHSLVTVPCFSFYLMARFYSKTIQDTTLPAIGISPWVPINCDNFWLFLFLVTLIDLRSTGQVYFRIPLYLCFPGGASGKESACQGKRHKRCRFNPWVVKIPWRREWHPSPAFLPGKSHRWRNPLGYSPKRGHKESNTMEHAHTCASLWEFFL